MRGTAYPHIEIDARGTSVIGGRPTRVVDVALDRLAYNWDAEEIQRQHPHLGLAQIYAALAFYHDNKAELDAQIEAGLQAAERIEESLGESTVRRKLKARKLRP